jgi:hypothetical protein
VTSFPESICPLCSQVFTREQLHQHIASESQRLRRSTIKVIQAYHPGWVEDDGACGSCWRSYRDAGRILNVMKSARPQNAACPWKPTELAAESNDQTQTKAHDAH